MRYVLSIFLFVLFLNGHAQVVIRGKINNYDGKSKVYYVPTIEGIHVPYAYEVLPSANGTFKIRYENPGYGTVTIGFRHLLYRFFHDPDSRIYFEIDQSKIRWPVGSFGRLAQAPWPIRDSVKTAATVVIQGDHAAVNNFYNHSLRISYEFRDVGADYYSQLIRVATSPENAQRILDSLKQREISQILRLPVPINLESSIVEKNNGEIKEFLINEVHSFYGSFFLKGLDLRRKDQIKLLTRDSTAGLSLYNRQWEELVEKFASEYRNTIKPAAASSDYNDFLESLSHTLLNYKNYNYPKNLAPLDYYVTKNLLNYDALIFSDAKAALAYRLRGLHIYLNNQLNYSPALLKVALEMQHQYPDSKNLKHLAPQIEKLKDYLSSSSKDYDEANIIKTNYTTLHDLLKELEGRNILLDIWATWCAPCVEQFKYKDIILDSLNDSKLEMLYISIDKPAWKDRWQQSINYNRLAGYHFRADDKFIKNMWEALGGEQGLIPRYVLIDENGSIFLSTAARPSDSEGLLKQIEGLLRN